MKNKLQKISAGIALGAMALLPLAPSALAQAAPTVKVTIVKYLDGQLATPASANSASFNMTATWTADNIGSGSGQFTLGPVGSNNPTPYEATTTDLSSGASYGVSENMDSVTGTACAPGETYKLAGYTSGDTLAAAAAATVSTTAPSLTNITSDKYILVWNDTCTTPTTPQATVHIAGYLDGTEATSTSAGGYGFIVDQTVTASNINGGQEYETADTLGNNGPHTYEMDSKAFDAPVTSYETFGLTGQGTGDRVQPSDATTCPANDFQLLGYTTSPTSFAAAASGTITTTAPTFTNFSNDQYVIIWYKSCGTASGTVSGDVTGGASADGTLAVTSVTPVQTTATADGTFEHGWKYTFNITVPDSETHLAMKFGDWMNTANSSTIAAANNIRISSAQADNSGATVLVTAANTYTTPDLSITGDLDAGMPGKQVQVTVEVAVPNTSVNGSYTTTYGVRTQP